MKKKMIVAAISVLCAIMLMVVAPGCGAAEKDNSINNPIGETNPDMEAIASNAGDPVEETEFISTDLTGYWKLQLRGNGNSDFGWHYMELFVNNYGQTGCMGYFDSTGNESCSMAPQMPNITINSKGVVRFDNVPIYGTMNLDRNAIYLFRADSNGVTHTGVMSRAATGFVNSDLVGQWNLQFRGVGNGNYDFGWYLMTVDVNSIGETTCRKYLDKDGNDSCDTALQLPAVTITPKGIVSFKNLPVYGAMDVDKNAVYLFKAGSNGVTHTGIMTKVSYDFVTSDLEGEWNLQIRGNESYGFTWNYLTMDVSKVGDVTCRAYNSDGGVNSPSSCPEIPNISINSYGIVRFYNLTDYGVMDVDRNAVYFVKTDVDGVTHTGVMTRMY